MTTQPQYVKRVWRVWPGWRWEVREQGFMTQIFGNGETTSRAKANEAVKQAIRERDQRDRAQWTRVR